MKNRGCLLNGSLIMELLFFSISLETALYASDVIAGTGFIPSLLACDCAMKLGTKAMLQASREVKIRLVDVIIDYEIG